MDTIFNLCLLIFAVSGIFLIAAGLGGLVDYFLRFRGEIKGRWRVGK